MGFDFLYNSFLKLLIRKAIQPIIIRNIYRASYKLLSFLSDFNENLNLKTTFFKKNQLLNLMKIRPVGGEMFHADRQTDRGTDRHEEANRLISQFCERN